jgi:hypothetical protein
MRFDVCPTLSLFKNDPRVPINGVGRLPAALAINSITEYPVFRYTAGGGLVTADDWAPWGYGENLDRVAVATPPTLSNGSPVLGDFDNSVKFNASDYFQANNNAFADITTEDFIFELVFKAGVTDLIRLIDKRHTISPFPGYLIQLNATTLRIFIDAGASDASFNTAALTSNMWLHAICFADRNGSGQWYVNGATSGAAGVISGASGSLASTSNFTVAATPAGLTPYDSNISYCALYKHAAGWFPSDAAGLAAQLVIAEQRASLFWGWRPYMARGTAVPTVRTRASNAYIDKVEGSGRRLYLIGNNVPRICSRLDTNGKILKGYLSEVQITNLILRSEEIDDAAWTTVANRTSVTNTSTTTLPNGITSVNDVLHEDATAANTHHISVTAVVAFANATKYIFSVFAKAINRNWIALYSTNNGVPVSAFFNLSTGVIGTLLNATAGIEGWGNGWYRCWAVWTTTAAHNAYLRCYIGEADNDTTFNGLDQDSVYLWGFQCEAGVDYPTSYMPTAATAVIREEDSLRYKGNDGNLGGVGSNMMGEIKVKELSLGGSSITSSIVDITFDGSSGSRILLYTAGGSGQFRIISASPIGNAGSVNDVDGSRNNTIYNVEAKYKINSERLYKDNIEVGIEDTDCGIPTLLSRIDVGQLLSSTSQFNGLLADIEIYDRDRRD